MVYRTEQYLGNWLAARGCRDRIVLANRPGHQRVCSACTPTLSTSISVFPSETPWGTMRALQVALARTHGLDPA